MEDEPEQEDKATSPSQYAFVIVFVHPFFHFITLYDMIFYFNAPALKQQ
jgi:hypothetical protein